MSSPVEQIKSRLSVVEVVQDYVKLQRAGSNYKALCPFHNEKTPSFFVSPTRESWHCFGCNKGGDIFSFVMEMEGVEFYDALKILARKAGVELKPLRPEFRDKKAKLAELLEEAKNFYQQNLKANSGALEYLKSRGLKDSTINSFELGFAPPGWRNLLNYLRAKGYSPAEMVEAGMVLRAVKGGEENFYDRFRSRIMFPLFNSSGQIVGFSGRAFGSEDEETAKYINTPQTILYDKSRLLYGFNKAKAEIRRKDLCIFVEGQMDVLMSHQAGFGNTVAVSGTAFTAEHLKLVKRLTENVVFAFDADEAGIKAAKRALALALAEGLDVKVALAPKSKDPADVIKEDPSQWEKVITAPHYAIMFFLETAKTRKEIEREVLPLIAVIPSEIEKAKWVKETAKKLSIAEEPVWEELKKIKTSFRQEPDKKAVPKKEVELGNEKSRLNSLENRLVGIFLWQKSAAGREEGILGKIGGLLKELGIETEGKEKFAIEAELLYNGKVDIVKEAEMLAREIRKERIKLELAELSLMVRKAENEGKDSEVESHLKKMSELTKKLNEI